MPSRGPSGVRGGADGRRPVGPQGDTADPQTAAQGAALPRAHRCLRPRTGGDSDCPRAAPPSSRALAHPLRRPAREPSGREAAPRRAAASHNSLTQRRRRRRGAVPPPPCSAAAARPGPAQRHPRGGSDTKARSPAAPAGTPLAWLPPRARPVPSAGRGGKAVCESWC